MILGTLAFGCGIALLSGVFTDTINQYLVRFSSVKGLSSLTTGRTELWEEYVLFFFNNPVDLLLGQGYTEVFNGVHKGSHNTIIQMIYQFGIVGLIPLVGWLSLFIKGFSLRLLFKPYSILIIFACFSMWLGLDMLYFDDFFLNISLLFMAMYEMRENQVEEKSVF